MFYQLGEQRIRVTRSSVSTSKSEEFTVVVKEASGAEWANKEGFESDHRLSALNEPFETNVRNFKTALENAGADVDVISVYRPNEKNWLMHYSFSIGINNDAFANLRHRMSEQQRNNWRIDPGDAPTTRNTETGETQIEICWMHRDNNGDYDRVASINAATELGNALRVGHHRPAVDSDHASRTAIDMEINWEGDLKIMNGNGETVIIDSEPRNYLNADLHTVGCSYGVTKLDVASDPEHWYLSDDCPPA